MNLSRKNSYILIRNYAPPNFKEMAELKAIIQAVESGRPQKACAELKASQNFCHVIIRFPYLVY